MKAKATKRAMAAVTRVASNVDGNSDGGKSDDHGNKSGKQARMRAMAAVTVAGDGRQGNGNEDKGCGQATAKATKRAVAIATRVVCEDEGDGKGGKSDCNGDKEGYYE